MMELGLGRGLKPRPRPNRSIQAALPSARCSRDFEPHLQLENPLQTPTHTHTETEIETRRCVRKSTVKARFTDGVGRSRQCSPARFPSVSGQEAGQVGMSTVQPESHTKLRGVELPEVKMGMAPEATLTGLLKASSVSVYCQPTPGPSLSEERMARVLSAKVCELVSIGGVFRGVPHRHSGGHSSSLPE